MRIYYSLEVVINQQKSGKLILVKIFQYTCIHQINMKMKLWHQVQICQKQNQYLVQMVRVKLQFGKVENKISLNLNILLQWMKFITQKGFQIIRYQIILSTPLCINNQFKFQVYQSELIYLVNSQKRNIQNKESFKKIRRRHYNQLQIIRQNDQYRFPIVYNKERNLILVRHKTYIYMIKEMNDGKFKIVDKLNCDIIGIFGTVTNNGQYLVYCDDKGKDIQHMNYEINEQQQYNYNIINLQFFLYFQVIQISFDCINSINTILDQKLHLQQMQSKQLLFVFIFIHFLASSYTLVHQESILKRIYRNCGVQHLFLQLYKNNQKYNLYQIIKGQSLQIFIQFSFLTIYDSNHFPLELIQS
ncbi:unnamed protein product [Paramecium sonneborni]|uniref:Uncharacterized protein n=1 Tax=Paramecium sonneborni TaxID=65129 RepID=A0A8S1NFP0_9CILI|nr:unnamed protein product [Paramecium sonneborni]